jgi:hypothetical protein
VADEPEVWVPEGEDEVIEPDGTVVDSSLDDGEAKPHPKPGPEKRQRLDIYHHFPDGIPLSIDLGTLNLGNLNIDVTGAVNVTVIEPTPSAPVATHAVLIIKSTTGGTNMPGSITVDTTNETVTLAFTDDHGDTDAVGPAGAVVTFASDNDAVATVANDASNAMVGDITPVAEGTANISATLTAADGTPLTEADGTTPFPTPDAVAVTVSAGAAVGDSLVLSV